jgi:hypothetical protein
VLERRKASLDRDIHALSYDWVVPLSEYEVAWMLSMECDSLDDSVIVVHMYPYTLALWMYISVACAVGCVEIHQSMFGRPRIKMT